jgi:DHA1 family multidrug resistance protein-like MFS transporter
MHYNLHRAEQKSRKLTMLHVTVLLMASAVSSIAYSAVLPVLPFLAERLSKVSNAGLVAMHTGFLTATYTIAVAVAAPRWGKLADSHGSKAIILIGLLGVSLSLAVFSFSENLYLVYVGRFFAGLFASAIAPAAMAVIGRYKASDEWKAHRLSWIGLASIIGAMIGPTFGSVALRFAKNGILPISRSDVMTAPFLLTSMLVAAIGVLIYAIFPKRYSGEIYESTVPETASEQQSLLLRLLILTFIAAAGVSAFEVLLTMRAKTVLGLDSYHIGLMFSECSVVMFLTQAIVFSPLVKPNVTRYLIVPALLVTIAGMLSIPFSEGFTGMLFSLGMVAAGAGVASPILLYWISLVVKQRQGESLGKQVAAASFGKASGAAVSGLLFGYTTVAYMPFLIIAVLIGIGLLLSLRLSARLTPFAFHKEI